MVFCSCKKKLEEKELPKGKMTNINLKKLQNLINSELTSKILNSYINLGELLIEIKDSELIEVVQFLKTNENCKFRQLIDIAGIDYPEDENRFHLVYLFLSHETNIRIKILVKLRSSQIINSLVKVFPSASWMEREVLDV